MLGKIFQRTLHTTRASLCINFKSLVAALRKKTGYTFNNCKMALELHNNDLLKAEEWLHARAKTEEWDNKTNKMEKINVRRAKEGLIGMMLKDNVAAMVEVNCETDSAVHSTQFQSLLSLITESALNYATGKALMGHDFHKVKQISIILSKVDFGNLRTLDDESTLASVVERHVDLLGEKLSLRRAVCCNVRDGLQLSGYIHPPYIFESRALMGKFGGLVCYRYKKIPEQPEKYNVSFKGVGYYLAKQVVEDNPHSIGVKNEDTPSDDPESETKLIFRHSLSNPRITVGEYLEQNGVEILDYIRFQCGESV